MPVLKNRPYNYNQYYDYPVVHRQQLALHSIAVSSRSKDEKQYSIVVIFHLTNIASEMAHAARICIFRFLSDCRYTQIIEKRTDACNRRERIFNNEILS